MINSIMYMINMEVLEKNNNISSRERVSHTDNKVGS